MSADPSSPHGVPVTSPSGGTSSAANGLTSPLASPSEGAPLTGPSTAVGNGALPPTLAAPVTPVVAIAGTGILLQSDYANGSGRANPHAVDHAAFAEAAATALNVPNLGTAALLDAPVARTNATASQLVRGDDTRLGAGSGTSGAQGPQGPIGASAYDLAVLNGFVGSQAQWLASLDGEPGPGGPAGPQGPQGISAYQVAVLNGFNGTQAQWLASLEGPTGPQGPQGPSGAGTGSGDMLRSAYDANNDGVVDHAALADLASAVAYSNVTGRPTLGTASPLDVAASGNASGTQVVKGNDTRLTDARTPTAHAPSHAANGSDALTLTKAQISDFPSVVGDMLKSVYDTNADGVVERALLADSANAVAYTNVTGKPSTFAPSPHAASHGSGGADAVTVANTQVTGLGTASTKDVAPSGNASATQVVLGNDGRLSDSRVPTNHASFHKSGGADAIKLDELAAPTDVTTLNVSTSVHGLVPKATGVGTQFLDGTGGWSTPAGTGGAGDMTASTYAAGTGSANTHTVDHALYADAAPYSGITGKPTLGTASAKDIPATGDASSTQVVYGTDTRLTNGRTPTSHAGTHASGGGDAVTLVKAQISDFPTLGTAAAKDIPASGNASSTQVVYGTDTRLGDSRTPSTHESTHITGGSDVIPAPTPAASGLVPALPSSGGANRLLSGTASWVGATLTATVTTAFNIPGVNSTQAIVVSDTSFLSNGMLLYFSLSGSPFATLEVFTISSGTAVTVVNRGYPASSAVGAQIDVGSAVVPLGPGLASATNPSAGLLPTPDNNAAHFLNGQLGYVTVAYASVSGTPTLGTAAAKDIPASGNASSTQVVYGSDTRLSDSRTPTAHAASHASGGSDAVSIVKAQVSDLGTIGTAAAKDIPASGNASATQVVYGSDTRLNDARTPSSHAASHKSGGGDPIKLDEFAAPTNVTTLDASTSAHGLMPKGTASTTTFYRSDLTQAAVAYAGVTGTPTLGTAAAKDIPASGDASATQVVYGTDSRLANARTPTTHASTHASGGGDAVTIVKAQVSDLGTIGTAAAKNIPASGNASATEVVYGNDTRLSDARTPSVHASSHASGGSDAVTLVKAQISDFPTLGTAAAKDIPAAGNASATQVVYGSDTRLSDGRTPTSHAATHLTGGGDTIASATATAAGLVPTPPNNVNKWYKGDSAWSYQAQSTETNGTFVVPAAGSTVAVTIVSASWPIVGQTLLITDGTRIGFFEITVVTSATALTVANRGYLGNSTSGTMATASTVRLMGPGIATGTQPGFVPTPDNTATHFLNGQMGYTAVAYSSLTGTPSTFAPSAHASTHQSGGGDSIALDTLAVPTDITTLNASTSAHGLMPKGTTSTTTFYRSDLTQATPPTVTRSAAGYAPASGGTSGTTNFLREDLSWAAPAGSTAAEFTTNASFTCPGAGSTVSVTFLTTTGMAAGMGLYVATAGLFNVSSVTNSTVAVMYNTGVTGNAVSGTIATAQPVYAAGVATVATATLAGYTPIPPNDATKVLKGDMSYGAVAYANVTGTPNSVAVTTSSFSMPAVGVSVSVAATNSSAIAKWSNVWVTGAGMMAQKGTPSGGNLALVNLGGPNNAAAAATIATAATVTVVDDRREDVFYRFQNHFENNGSIFNQTANSGVVQEGWSQLHHPGVTGYTTGATANAASLFTGNATSQVVLGTTTSTAIRFVFILPSPILVITTQGGAVKMGLVANSVTSLNSGMWIAWDPAVNSSRWTLNCANGSTVSTSNGTMASPVAATWYESILTFDGTTVNASIGPWGGTLAAFTGLTTNVPASTTTGLTPSGGIIKSSGTAESKVQFDLFEVIHFNASASSFLGASMLP